MALHDAASRMATCVHLQTSRLSVTQADAGFQIANKEPCEHTVAFHAGSASFRHFSTLQLAARWRWSAIIPAKVDSKPLLSSCWSWPLQRWPSKAHLSRQAANFDPEPSMICASRFPFGPASPLRASYTLLMGCLGFYAQFFQVGAQSCDSDAARSLRAGPFCLQVLLADQLFHL